MALDRRAHLNRHRSHPLSEIPGVLRVDGSPPFYYVRPHAWTALFGTSELLCQPGDRDHPALAWFRLMDQHCREDSLVSDPRLVAVPPDAAASWTSVVGRHLLLVAKTAP